MQTRLPRVAHGLFTWRDGRQPLEACLRSTAGHVDELIIADGLIKGVNPNGQPWFSDLAWLADADWLPARVPISTKEWDSLSAACNWILASARRLDCEWLLFIDGDQELHNGHALREWLAGYSGDAFPLERADNGVRHPVPWQCVRVAAVRRYLAGCFIVEDSSGQTVTLVVDEAGPAPAGAPWISHHPERRPAHRRAHRLGDLETILEPPPPATPLRLPSFVLEPSAVSDTPAEGTIDSGEPTWYCDQCGARFFAAGVCANAHPPAELQRIPDAGEAAGGGGGAVSDSPDDEVPAAAVATSAAAPPDVAPPAPGAVEEIRAGSFDDALAEPPAPASPPSAVVPQDIPAEVAEAKSLLSRALELLHSL